MAGKVVKDMSEDFLNCCICMSSFKTPKMLPCIHSFCEGCLEKYAAKQNTDQIPCPTCRKVCKLPQTGVKGLQTNFHLINLAERVALLEKLTSTQKSAATCDSCKNTEIVAFCVNCNFTICNRCQSQHSLFPLLHVVISLTHINDPKFQQEWKQLKSPFCQLHSSEKLNFYCNTCSQLICRDCTIVQHSKPDHKCVEASSKFANIKDNLCKLLEDDKEELEGCSALLHEGAKGYALMNEELKRVEKELDLVCKRNLLEIEGKYKDLKVQMVAKIAERFFPVKEQIDFAENWIKRMQNTQEISQTVIEENNPWELLAMSTDLTAAFEELTADSKTIELGPSALKHNISFSPFPVPELQLGAWHCFPADDVATDAIGTFFLCDFNKATRMLSIAKISTEDLKMESVLSYEWTDFVPKGSTLKADEGNSKYLFIGLGRIVAKFDYVSKSFVSKKEFNVQGPIHCIAYNKPKSRLCVTSTDSNMWLCDSSFSSMASYNLKTTSPTVFLCPHNFGIVYYTTNDGMKRFHYTNRTYQALEVPLPAAPQGNPTIAGIMQSNNDGNHTIFILQKAENGGNSEEAKAGPKSDAWMAHEYRVDLKKVVGILESAAIGMSRPPKSLFGTHAGDGVALHLCDGWGNITTCKRGVYQQNVLKYEKA